MGGPSKTRLCRLSFKHQPLHCRCFVTSGLLKYTVYKGWCHGFRRSVRSNDVINHKYDHMFLSAPHSCNGKGSTILLILVNETGTEHYQQDQKRHIRRFLFRASTSLKRRSYRQVGRSLGASTDTPTPKEALLQRAARRAGEPNAWQSAVDADGAVDRGLRWWSRFWGCEFLGSWVIFIILDAPSLWRSRQVEANLAPSQRLKNQNLKIEILRAGQMPLTVPLPRWGVSNTVTPHVFVWESLARDTKQVQLLLLSSRG